MEHLIRHADTRTTVTPAASMTTLASPTLGGTEGRSLWQVDMAAATSGPLHVFDSEQVWTVLVGEVTVDVDGVARELGAGDTIVIPGELERQVHATSDCRMIVTGDASATARVPGEAEPRGTPAWIA